MQNEAQKLVYIVSLGCPKNLVDTEVLTASLLKYGFGLSNDPENAEVFLVSTCAFIPPAREEAAENIAEAEAWKDMGEDRKIVVAGCLPQWDKNCEFRSKFPTVELWLGVDSPGKFGWELARLYAGLDDSIKPGQAPLYLYDHNTPRLQLTLPHYAYLKIADGCDNRCSYCSIPTIRGKLRSRRISSVVKEAENLLDNGVRELILIAQDTTAFGDDRDDNSNLPALLRELEKLPGKFWLRLLYTHPASFIAQQDELIGILRTAQHLLPYVDMPLQHISDPILQSMGRKAGKKGICELLAKLPREIPEIAIRTTFLVGYPGETDENFSELREFVQEQQFTRLGVFPYFPEPDTPATELPDQVSAEIAGQRADEIMALQEEISVWRNSQLAGQIIDVIIDGIEEGGTVLGRSWMDAPEIDNRVIITGAEEIPVGEIGLVKITEWDAFELTGAWQNDD